MGVSIIVLVVLIYKIISFLNCSFYAHFQVSMTVLDSAEMEEHAQTWRMTTSAAVPVASQARIVRPTLTIVRVIPV